MARDFRDPDDPSTAAAVVALHRVPVSETNLDEEQPWLIRGVLRIEGSGRLVLVRLSVEHFNDPTVEVTGYVLHRLPIGTIRKKAFEWLEAKHVTLSAFEATGLLVSDDEKAWERRVTAAVKKPRRRRPGPQGHGDDFYRGIALRAIKLYDGLRRRDVVKALTEERQAKHETVRGWIRVARERGFLATVTQGRTDFRAGPNLYPTKEDEHG